MRITKLSSEDDNDNKIENACQEKKKVLRALKSTPESPKARFKEVISIGVRKEDSPKGG